MSSFSADHKEVVHQEFTKQAEAYAANGVLADQSRLNRLVRTVQPQP